MYTSLYVGFLQPDTLGFLIFIAVVPTAVVLIAACFVNFVPFTQAKEIPSHTGNLLCIATAIDCLTAHTHYLISHVGRLPAMPAQHVFWILIHMLASTSSLTWSGAFIFAGVRLTRTVQLLLALAAYLLVTAVLKSTLDLSKRTCCILAIGAPL